MFVRAGHSIRIGMTLRGAPLPTVNWAKIYTKINEMATAETIKNYSMLSIENCSVSDSGRYEFILKSSSGDKEGLVNVRVIAAPSAPLNVAAAEIKTSELKLIWEASTNDGCGAVTYSIVEKRSALKKS